ATTRARRCAARPTVSIARSSHGWGTRSLACERPKRIQGTKMRRLIINLTDSAHWLAGLVLGAWLALGPAHAEDAATGFRRGIAVAHAMAWAAVEPAPSRSFVYPPFADSAKNLGAELKGLRRSGFDFVRLAVDPGPFLQLQGSRRDRL